MVRFLVPGSLWVLRVVRQHAYHASRGQKFVLKRKQLFWVRNERTGELVGVKVLRADTFWLRLRGLLGRSRLEEGEGLWLAPCRQVHMLGMRFPLSVWFLDQDGVVCAIINELKPGQISPRIKTAVGVIEFAAGWAQACGTSVGDRLTLAPQK